MNRTDAIAKAIVLTETDNYQTWPELDALWKELKDEYKHISFATSIGDSVGAGWWAPLLEAFDGIEALLVAQSGYVFNVRQIKEKFGGLRFYWNLQPVDAELDEDGEIDWGSLSRNDEFVNLRESISKLVDAADEACAKRCETCGEPGELRSGGWLKTLCDKHNKGRK